MAKKLFRWYCHHCNVEYYGLKDTWECPICGGNSKRIEWTGGYIGGTIKSMDNGCQSLPEPYGRLTKGEENETYT
jgi:hypothetical protein